MRAAIGAIISCDGKPVELCELKLLAARARLPWGGSPQFFLGEGAGLLSIPAFPVAAHLTASVPPAEAGYLGEEPGRYVVVVDGTIDNRAELARKLGLPPLASTPEATSRLIATTYERWGANCAAHLHGEFAFLLWDRRERRLLAARDALGLRELFTRDLGRESLIASQLQMLLESPGLSGVDEEFVADFLSCRAYCGPGTPFKSVRRLQAGHWLSLSSSRSDTQRFWSPPSEPESSAGHRSDGEIEEHFLSVFREAVDRCLGTGGRVWAELSGGLDSSSITALAHEILKNEPGRARDFATVTSVFDHTPQSDERSWSEAVVERYELTNHKLVCDDLFFDGAGEESRHRNEPHFGILGHPMSRAESELLRASGVEVLLSGARAEAVVLGDWASPLHLADLLRGLCLRDFARELMHWQRATHRPIVNLLLAFALQPLLSRRRYLRSQADTGALDPWVDKEFARRMKLLERARKALAEKRFHSIAQQSQFEQLVRSEQMINRGFIEWSCEIRHPFLYLPLVELALSIPWKQKVSPQEAKPLLRRSLAGRLPERVITRRGGAGPGPAMYKAFAKRWAAIEPVVSSSLLVSMGFVDATEFKRAAELVRFGAAYKFPSFLSCLAFEYWLRAVAL